jgi:6-phosphofructokinase 1
MKPTIGVVTGGGDCPGLNAVIRAVAKAAHRRGWTAVGIVGGYEGVLPPQQTKLLEGDVLNGLLIRGGTILGTANQGKFSAKVGHGESRRLPVELLDATKRGCEQLGLVGLVSIGGDGSLSIAQQLHEHGIPIIGVPKTIDNDLAATMMTFGFDSAVACATDAMGRYAGWIAIYAGLAGGADVILIPEIPFTYDSICEKLDGRQRAGKSFSIVVVAEGARPAGTDFVTSAEQSQNREARLGGIGAQVAQEIQKRTSKETRCVVLGHLQRGGGPTNMDRALCTIFGAKAVELIADKQFGRMVSFSGTQVTSVPLAEATGKLRTVPLDGGFVTAARSLGICLGD